MKPKLLRAMLERDAGKPPMRGRVEIDDACLRGVRSGGKRGRGAVANTPFVTAVETTADQRPRRIKLALVKGFGKKEIETFVKASFAPRTNLASFTRRFNRRYQLDTLTERLAWAGVQCAPKPYRVVIAG